MQFESILKEAKRLKLSNDLLSFLSGAAPGKSIMLMFILGESSKKEWKYCGKENRLNYFVEKNPVVENRIQGTS